MKTIPLQHILDMAPQRPSGYVAECLALGKRNDDNTVTFDDETYELLVAKYRVTGSGVELPCCD